MENIYTTGYVAPGRLGNPHMTLSDDPRLHPDLLKVFQRHGILDQSFLAPQITPDSSLEEICRFVREGERTIEGFLNSFDYEVAEPSSTVPIVRSTSMITGPEGNEIRLIINRPATDVDSGAPGVIYFHGGGMVILDVETRQHTTWIETLAKRGLVTISVDFRNALTSDGQHPFPAGLSDCAAAVRWVHAHRRELGIDKIILQGNSGGANLAMATALKAKQEGWLDAIDAVHALSPYISGAYERDAAWKLQHLPSLVEVDGYAISVTLAALNAKLYDPNGENRENPLAWPYWATVPDVEGLPPHFIVTNELDPYRDEGNAYARLLACAGVRVTCRSNLGVTHEAELAFRRDLPHLFLANLSELLTFIDLV